MPGANLLRYKKPETSSVREQIFDALMSQLGDGIDFADEVRERCLRSHDDLDALICALVARAVQMEQTNRPRADMTGRSELASAQSEGWIHLPNAGSLAALTRAALTRAAPSKR